MKKNILPMIGSLLGGLVATLPWVLVYVYGNMMYSILAILVAMGALYGYQLFKGEVNRQLPLKIIIVSLLSISLANLVIIPCLLLAKEGLEVTISNFTYLYQNSEFIRSSIIDYIVSIVFTLLGISWVIKSIKGQVENNNDGKIKIDLSNGNSQKNRLLVKNLLLDKGAVDRESAINFAEDDKVNNNTLNILISQGIVVKVEDDKYYYDSEKEVLFNKQNNKTVVISMVIVLAFLGLLTYFAISNNNDDNDNNQEVERVLKYSVPTGYKEYDDEDGGYYYVPTDDLTGESGYIDVYYLEGEYIYTDDFVNNIKANIEDDGKVLGTDEFTNKYNHKVVSFIVEIDDYITTVYYIFSGSDLGVVEVIDYIDNKKLNSDAKEIANNFTWNSSNIDIA